MSKEVKRLIEFLDDHVMCGSICVCQYNIVFHTQNDIIEDDKGCTCEENERMSRRSEGEYFHKELLDEHVVGFGLYMGGTELVKLYSWGKWLYKHCINLYVEYHSDLVIYQDTREIAKIMKNLPAAQYYQYCTTHDLRIFYSKT